MAMPLPAFFDDFVVPVLSPTPADLFADVTTVLACTGRSFATGGMAIKDKPGKTEAVIAFHGEGSHSRKTMTMALANVRVKHEGTFKKKKKSTLQNNDFK